MQIRRCAVAWLEPREVADFRLEELLAARAVSLLLAVLQLRVCIM